MDLSPVDNNILDEFNERLLPLHDQLGNPPAVLDLEWAEALLWKQKRSAERVTQSLETLQKLICNRGRELHKGDTSVFLADPHDGHGKGSIALGRAVSATRRVTRGRSDHEKFGYLKTDVIRDADISDAIDLGPNGNHRSIGALLRGQSTHESSLRDRSCDVLLAGGAESSDSFPTPYPRNMSNGVAKPERGQLFRSTNFKADLGYCDSHPLWTSPVDSSDLVSWSEYRDESDTIASVPLINAPGASRSIDGYASDPNTSREPTITDDTAPIEIGSDTNPEFFSSFTTADSEQVSLVPDSLESIGSCIRAANSTHRLPDGTLERFSPGEWLNDLNIAETLRLLLPLTAEPLIASQAIQNFPMGGLARKWIPTDASVPILRHSEHCTHLFIAYNVVYGTLDDMGTSRNNHWVLVAVDITMAKIHVFGTDSGSLESGRLVALNIGVFVNNCRSKRHHCLVHWSDPNLQPLYEHGVHPDSFSCGIAVISRAVSFLYPSWALNFSVFAGPVEPTRRLSEWRYLCLCLFLDRYRVIHTENNLVIDELSSTNLSRKRSAIPNPYYGREARIFTISHSLVMSSPAKGPARLNLREIQDWKTCIRACAAAKGFHEYRVIEAFENAPDQPIEHVLRVLQCICEVASPNILRQLKHALLYRVNRQSPHDRACTSADIKELSHLHILINGFSTAIPFLSRYEALCHWISYSKFFDAAVASRTKIMKPEKLVRRQDRRVTRVQQGISNLQPKATVGGDPPNATADHLVRRELEESLIQKNIDAGEARLQVTSHLLYSRKLRLLLSDIDTCWLLLMPVQAAQQDFLLANNTKPILNLMDFSPPKTIRKLEKPVSSNDLLKPNLELAKYFGQYLFTARPELKYLYKHVTDIFNQAEGVHPLCARTDADIIATKPKNIAGLFESTGP